MWNSSISINDTQPVDDYYDDESNETFDELKYLAQMLGPQRQPLNKLVPLTIVYTVMSITGIFGNLSVCCVILRIPSMRSATNYYLFSLAVSDLLILLLGKKTISNKTSWCGYNSNILQVCLTISTSTGNSIPGFSALASAKYGRLYPKCKLWVDPVAWCNLYVFLTGPLIHLFWPSSPSPWRGTVIHNYLDTYLEIMDLL